MEKTAGTLSPTVHLQTLLEEAAREPFKTLAAWPLAEIRKACLEALRRNPYGRIGDQVSADRVEELIRSFKNAHDPIWEELFNWYVHFAGEGKIFHASEGTRAVEFAIAWSKEGTSVLHEAARAVCDKLRQRPRLYWEASSLLKLLISLLSAVEGKHGYGAGTWQLTERAIRRIVAAEDISFLEHIGDLYQHHHDGRIHPDDSYQREDIFAGAENQAFLAEASQRLSEASKRQMPDLSATVGSFLRLASHLGGIVVRVQLRPLIPKENMPLAVRVIFSTTKGEELGQLLSELQHITVKLESDGSVEVKRQGEKIRHGEWHMIGDSSWPSSIIGGLTNNKDKPVYEFLVRSRPGRRRLWLTFQKGSVNLTEMALYVTFE